LNLSVMTRIFSREEEFLGTLHLIIEGVNPDLFQNYEEMLIFPEWFCFCFMKGKTLWEIKKEVRNAGGTIIPFFVNKFNEADRKVFGIETQLLGEITHIS